MKKMLSIIISLSLFITPILAQSTQADACTQASLDAKNKVDGNIWFGAGCLFGLVGLGVAYLIEPNPSATSLLGKDANYVATYTDCYKVAGKNVQTSKAMKGCLIGTAVSLVYLISVGGLTASSTQ